MASPLSPAELLRYARHLSLPGVGRDGQTRLKAARVVVIGAGGLGSPAALYLAAAGVGTLGLVDFDRVDITNLQRQILHQTGDVGRPKVLSGAEHLAGLNPHVHVVPIEQRLSATVVLENDANAAALGEAWLGAARQVEHMCMITLGTGVGGGIVVVPMLTLFFHVDIRYAIGASLVSVIATSSGAAAAYVREGYTNVRVGILLEVATTVGALFGAALAGVTLGVLMGMSRLIARIVVVIPWQIAGWWIVAQCLRQVRSTGIQLHGNHAAAEA